MRDLIKLTCGFVAGTPLGFLASIEMFGGTITTQVLHTAALLTLATAGLCAVAVFGLRRAFGL